MDTEDKDVQIARRVRDIVAVVATDMDAVHFDVEDGVAYIEGVVGSDVERRAISNAISHVDGLNEVVTCLATEHVLEPSETQNTLIPPQVIMHYHSLS